MKKTNPLKKADQTRQYIIEKTAPVFNKKGIVGTSLADLTRATGLTKGSIYGNFKDKDEVAVAVFEYNIANLIKFLNKNIDQQTAYLDKLLAIPEAYRRLYQQMVQFGGCPIANTATEADDTHPLLRKSAIKTIELLTRNMVDLMEKGKKAGEIQHLVDSEKTANIIISLIEGGSVLSKATGNKQFLSHSLEQIEYLIHSIRQPVLQP
ncbi:TetR/AcrR family transcriptional regulator [bacterium]|nr:TetR/AcrR family transcriptional regulator [bacterium]